jgi:hypothetical protein
LIVGRIGRPRTKEDAMSVDPQKAGTKPVKKADPKPEVKKPKAEHQARMTKLKSRGSEYTQLWLSRGVGEKLVKGRLYNVEVQAGGKLLLTPRKNGGSK